MYYNKMFNRSYHSAESDVSCTVKFLQLSQELKSDEANKFKMYANKSTNTASTDDDPFSRLLKLMSFNAISDMVKQNSIDLNHVIHISGWKKFKSILSTKSNSMERVLREHLVNFYTLNPQNIEEIANEGDLSQLLQYPHIVRQLCSRHDIPLIQQYITHSLGINGNFIEGLKNNQDCMPFLPLNTESFEYYAGWSITLETEAQSFWDNIKSFYIKDDSSSLNNKKIKHFSSMYRCDPQYLSDLRSGIYEFQPADPTASNKTLNIPMADRTEMLTNISKTFLTKGDITLYRGLGSFKSIFYMANLPISKCIPKSIIGEEIFDRSFTSYSTQQSVAQHYADMSYHEDNSPPPIIKVTIPKGVHINAVPIGNEYSEVVLNRYQKLRVKSIKKDKIDHQIYMCINCEIESNYDNTEEQIYRTPEFKNYQSEFEINLGKYLYRKEGSTKGGRAYKALQLAIKSIRKKYPRNRTNREIFYSNTAYTTPDSIGSVTGIDGCDLNDKEIDSILSDGIPTDKQLKSNNRLIPGNFREKMTAVTSVLGNLDDPIQFNKIDELGEPLIYHREKDTAQQEELRKDIDYQDQMGLTRSQRERDYQYKNQHANHKSPLTYGKMKYIPMLHHMTNESLLKSQSNSEFTEIPIDSFYGKILIGGTSETAMNLLRAYSKYVSQSPEMLLNFRLAIMAYMLPEEEHSLYEILTGSHQAQVRGYENLSTADTMDKSIDPISEETLRNIPEVCKDKLFPYERAYKEYTMK